MARTAWIGLPASETIYATAMTDSAGEKLRAQCSYRIAGRSLNTRWWSLTLYRDAHWIANPAHRYAWASSDATQAHDGRWEILLSQHAQTGNWLPMDDAPGHLSLVFRLYNPAQGLTQQLRTTEELPVIERRACLPA